MKTLIGVIEEMFLTYVRTEEYVSMNEEARNNFVDQIEELKRLAAEK